MRVTRAPRRLVREIEVNGVVQTRADADAWWEAFVGWLESRGERFNGRIAPVGRAPEGDPTPGRSR
jgi:hypothetical protein